MLCPSIMLQRIRLFRADATENALNVVRSVIDKSTEPLSTQTIWKHVVREEAAALGTSAKVDASQQNSTEQPFPNHAVRSMRQVYRYLLHVGNTY